MFTFALYYIYIYVCLFLSLLILSFLFFPISLLTQYSISSYLIILQKYSILKNLFFLIIFSLTGLPPVGLFFIKFNLLAYVLYQTHFIIIIFLFLVFFLNMLYYIQLFNIKNYKKNIYPVLNTNTLLIWKRDLVTKHYLFLYTHYYLILFIITTVGFIFLNFLFYADIFLILSL